MLTFNEQITAALTAAQQIYGTSFTLNDDEVTPFLAVLNFETNTSTATLGTVPDDSDAEAMAGKAQFDAAGVTPTEGDRVAIGSNDFRILRVSEDETTYTLTLKRRHT